MTELEALIDREIPEGRQQMENSYANLERVAAFCEANYLQASDKAAALEETRKYTVQSLASVAYQVNTLASNLLQMLDLQAEKIGEMESQVHNISQVVDIHKEKVARREIGVLTTNKTVPKLHKIIAPHQQEKPQRYIRRPIDYSVLDNFGHGIKVPKMQPQGRFGVARTGSTVSAESSGSGGSAQPWGLAPETPQYFPTSHGMRIGSVSKATSRDYRTPVTVAAPMAPGDLGQRYPGMTQNTSAGNPQLLQRLNSNSGNYSAVSVPSRGSYNDSQTSSRVSNYSSTQSYAAGGSLYMQDGNQNLSAGTLEEFPPPPSPGPMDFRYADQHSPPLPPPPMDDSGSLIPEMPQYGVFIGRRDANLPDWVPRDFIEKVVAMYDYQAEKSDELSFQENSEIYVLKKNEDGWYEGVLDGMTGLFPGNYVEACNLH